MAPKELNTRNEGKPNIGGKKSTPSAHESAVGEAMDVDGGAAAPTSDATSATMDPAGNRGGESNEKARLRHRIGRLEGELKATSKGLAAAEERANGKDSQIVDAIAESKYATKMKETAEALLRARDAEYKVLYDKYTIVKEDLDELERKYTKACDRVQDLEERLD
ncbi:hypothetical protein C8R44DRAFT_875174 [Mycena epipterygia]|nr:hypothetical protein C8R44DRAFT_875174 [Mycena epipterygia]